MTPSGIEPATFRFVAQNLNHCATAVPQLQRNNIQNKFLRYRSSGTAVVLWDTRIGTLTARDRIRSFYFWASNHWALDSAR
jgi:hypothetical protein